MVIHCDRLPRSASSGGIRLRVLQVIAVLLAAVVVVQQWRTAQPPPPPRPTPLPLAVFTGRIVDTQGTPQAGLGLTFNVDPSTRSGQERRRQSWSATSGADGTFTAFVPKTRMTVQCKERPLHDPGPLAFDLERIPPPHLEIVVLTAAQWPPLSGVVVDEQGRPIADAEVAAIVDYSEEGTVTTSEQGTFELPRPVAAVASHALLSCRHHRYEWPQDAFHAWGRRDLRLVMQSQVPVEVRVVDDQGRDLAVAKIAVQSAGGGRIGVPGCELEHVGKTWRGELWRGVAWFRIELDPKVVGWYTKLPQHAEIAEPTLAATFVLPRMATRTVRVVTGDGAPITGSRVQLIMPQGTEVSATAIAQSCGTPVLPGRPIELDDAITDAQGQVSLTGPSGSALVIRACGPGHLPEVVAAVDLTVAAPLTVATRPGAHTQGRIHADAVLAEFLRKGDWGLRLLRTHDGTFEDWPMDVPAAVDASGSFAISGAATGEWTPLLVQPRKNGVWSERCEPLPAITLSATTSAPVKFDLSHWTWVHLRGRVLVDGAAVAGQHVEVLGEGEAEAPRSRAVAETNADGRFQVRVRSGRLRIRHGWPPCESEPVLVDHAHDEHAFAIETGKLELTLVDERGEPQRGRQVHLVRAPDDLGWIPANSDGDGIVHLRLQPQPWVVMFIHEEEFKVATAGDRLLERLRDARALLGTVTVRAGATVRERLTLPPR